MKKNKLFILLFICIIISAFSPLNIAVAEDWRQVKGKHFIIYHAGEKKFANDVLYKAEKYYNQIARELGYNRYSKFWTWDNRVKIFIYPDKDSFVKATGARAWAEGLADYTNKQIISYAWSQDFTDALLPHEITHLIFRDYVGFEGEVPLCFDEGVAQWMEPKKRKLVKQVVKRILEKNELLSIQKLISMDKSSLQDKKQVEIFYIQSVSLVGFLIEEYGGSRFARFCRSLRDGNTLKRALAVSYPDSIDTIEALEKQWRKYIEKY